METVGLFKELQETARLRRNSPKQPSELALRIAGFGAALPDAAKTRSAAARGIIDVFLKIGVDRNALADEIGLSRSSTGHWSRGENSISRHNLAVLIDALIARFVPAREITDEVHRRAHTNWASAIEKHADSLALRNISFKEALEAAEDQFPSQINLTPTERIAGRGSVRMSGHFAEVPGAPTLAARLASLPSCDEVDRVGMRPPSDTMHWVRIGDDYRCGDLVISPDDPGYQVTHKACGREIVVGVLQLADAFALCHELAGTRAAD